MKAIVFHRIDRNLILLKYIYFRAKIEIFLGSYFGVDIS